MKRILVDVAEAWKISDLDADYLESLGFKALSVGEELSPPKRIYCVTPSEIRAVSSAARIPVRLNGELLRARNLALIKFGDASSARHSSTGAE